MSFFKKKVVVEVKINYAKLRRNENRLMQQHDDSKEVFRKVAEQSLESKNYKNAVIHFGLVLELSFDEPSPIDIVNKADAYLQL